VFQLALRTGQTAHDLPQRFGLSQLAKQHGDQLRPATESLGVLLGPMLPDRLLELDSGQEAQYLRKNAAYSIHGGNPLGSDRF
jgi:hypothetical protein